MAPLDIPLFQGMVEWLEKLDTDNSAEEYIDSKPYRFMMECVSRYVNENIEKLTDKDLLEIMRFWEEYEKRSK